MEKTGMLFGTIILNIIIKNKYFRMRQESNVSKKELLVKCEEQKKQTNKNKQKKTNKKNKQKKTNLELQRVGPKINQN